MSSQMIDLYLDELLAPLAEPARDAISGMASIASTTEAFNKADIAVVSNAPGTALGAAANQDDPAKSELASPPAPRPAPVPVPVIPPAIAEPAAPMRAAPTPLPQRTHSEPSHRPTQGSANGTRWLRAMLDRDRYAFELLRVQEVVRMAPIIALRGTSRAMLGVMNLRGRIVPVFDLALWLGTGHVTVDEHARIIVVERDDELIGVLVSAVDDVVTLAREHIEPPLPGNDPGGVLGIARVSRAPTVLLDANALFA